VEVGRELFTRRKSSPVHEEVKPAELAIDFGEDMGDLRIVGDVARKNEGVGQAGAKISNVLLEPFALVGQREPRTGGRGGLRDCPGDGAFVGDADYQARLLARSVM
jgi:hypothetical protein